MRKKNQNLQRTIALAAAIAAQLCLAAFPAAAEVGPGVDLADQAESSADAGNAAQASGTDTDTQDTAQTPEGSVSQTTGTTDTAGTQTAEEAAAAWDAERATLNLTRSIAGTVKPWLFYKDGYYDRQVLFDRAKQLWWYKKMINEKLYTPLTQNGIRLVIMIVPDKESLYGLDYLPEEYAAALRRSDRIDQFKEYMAKEFPQLEIYYAKDDMLAAKANGLPLYYASDSHWNYVGAGVCAEGLMNYLGADYALTEKPAFSYRLTGETAEGDLQAFEHLDASFNRVEYAADGAWSAEKTSSVSDATGEEVYAVYRSTDERALPKKLYFCGDSYRWYIQYLLNGQFSESWFVQRYQYAAQDAIKVHPDVFVYEIPERFLPQFADLKDI